MALVLIVGISQLTQNSGHLLLVLLTPRLEVRMAVQEHKLRHLHNLPLELLLEGSDVLVLFVSLEDRAEVRVRLEHSSDRLLDFGQGARLAQHRVGVLTARFAILYLAVGA